ncbi:MAG: hypothetical protein NTU63_01115 [Candidatus Pacearchaeota archaeon]|nr:hypothetical protein [Candidatus Pacearchaeota archaeon]
MRILELLAMCESCRAIRINEKPGRWIRYNFLTKNLYINFTDKCKGLYYSYCPRCSRRLRRAIKSC